MSSLREMYFCSFRQMAIRSLSLLPALSSFNEASSFTMRSLLRLLRRLVDTALTSGIAWLSTHGTWTFSVEIGPETLPLSNSSGSTSITIIISGNLRQKEVNITFHKWMRRSNGLTMPRSRTGSRGLRTWQQLYWHFEIYFFSRRNPIPICPMIPTHLLCPKIRLDN